MQDHHQFWHIPPAALQLAENEIHVWRASLAVPSDTVERLQPLLIDEEIARARRFYFERDRHHWTVARATLRALLGRYLAVTPPDVSLANNEYGKPALSALSVGRQLHFNLSHSGDLALYAFAYEREVGVDVEQVRANIDYTDLATHYFSERECQELRSLPAHRQQEAFFLCWSRKEAYIKARGKGLSLPLEQFDVSLHPDEPARLLGSREEPEMTQRWSLAALFPGTGYVGALVAEGSGWQFRCWQWLVQ